MQQRMQVFKGHKYLCTGYCPFGLGLVVLCGEQVLAKQLQQQHIALL